MNNVQSRFEKTVLRTSVLFHWVTDANQALLPGVSPILKVTFELSYFQLGALFGAFLLVAAGREQALSMAWIPYMGTKYQKQEIITDLLVTLVSIGLLFIMLASA